MGRIQEALKRAESSRNQGRQSREVGLREISVEFLDGDARGFRRRFRQHSILIGRGDQNDVAFDAFGDATVSSHHAEIRLEGDDVVLYDLGSLNGCFVADERIRRVLLQDKTELGLGRLGPRLRIELGDLVSEAGPAVPAMKERQFERDTSVPDTAETPVLAGYRRSRYEPVLLGALLLAVLLDALISLSRNL